MVELPLSYANTLNRRNKQVYFPHDLKNCLFSHIAVPFWIMARDLWAHLSYTPHFQLLLLLCCCCHYYYLLIIWYQILDDRRGFSWNRYYESVYACHVTVCELTYLLAYRELPFKYMHDDDTLRISCAHVTHLISICRLKAFRIYGF